MELLPQTNIISQIELKEKLIKNAKEKIEEVTTEGSEVIPEPMDVEDFIFNKMEL